MSILTQFIPHIQHSYIKSLLHGEEASFYKQKLTELEALITTMPHTYQQDGIKDPTVHLHYFYGGSDWYITEKDIEPNQRQAFGYAILNDGKPEAGYIPITELIKSNRVELDLYFTPKPISQIPKLAAKFFPSPVSASEQDPSLQTISNIIPFPTQKKPPLTQRFPLKP